MDWHAGQRRDWAAGAIWRTKVEPTRSERISTVIVSLSLRAVIRALSRGAKMWLVILLSWDFVVYCGRPNRSPGVTAKG
jgi:hypothetical protein